MVDIKKDSKGKAWIITKRDNEGFHRQLALTEKEMNEVVRLWTERV